MIDLFPNQTFFFQLAIFLTVLMVLSKGLFKPVIAVLDERKRRSSGTLQEAAALEADLEQKVAHCEKVLQDARSRALAERETIRQRAVAEGKNLVGAAKRESETTIETFRKSLQEESRAAKLDLGRIAGELTERVVKKVLTSILAALVVFLEVMEFPAQAMAEAAEPHSTGIPASVWFHFVNFFILVGILVYVLRKPLKAFFADRHSEIEKAVNAAQIRRSELEGRALEVNARLAKIEDEVRALATSIIGGAEAEHRMLVDEAKALAKRIQEEVGLLTDQELKKAKEELKVQALTLVFERAEGKLRQQFNNDRLDATFERGRLGELGEIV